VFCTGLGTVTNQPPTGAAAPLSPLSWTIQNSTVTIAGIPANVVFSGLRPGTVGFDQVDVLVPANVASASAAALLLSSGGNSTTSAIAVQAGGAPAVQISISPATATVQTGGTV